MANDFAVKYTEANVAQDAAQYDSELFLQLHHKLDELLLSRNLATALIVRDPCLSLKRLANFPRLLFSVGKDVVTL
jgi:hypothetical protein